MANKEQMIASFLGSQLLGVLSTVNADGHPQSALVAFSELPDLRIVFGTSLETRKFRNLQQNPHVSFTVSGKDACVQLEGIARVVEGAEEDECRTLHLRKNPAVKKYASDPLQRYVVITPSWIRYTDNSTKPHTVEELSF